MSSLCEWLHNVLEPLPLIRYPFENTPMPDNGIYFFYEEGEFWGHGSNLQRIVRVGTHRDGNFRQRIASHFLINSNLMNFNANSAKPSDRSIFRKNFGRALLNRAHDPYLEVWEIDFTNHGKKQLFGHRRNIDKEKEIEEEITAILRKNFTFRFIEVEGQQKRMGTEGLESKLIGTLASCPDCTPSTNWLGLNSPVKKVARSGLWLVQHLKSPSLSEADKSLLEEAIEKTLIKYGKKV